MDEAGSGLGAVVEDAAGDGAGLDGGTSVTGVTGVAGDVVGEAVVNEGVVTTGDEPVTRGD